MLLRRCLDCSVCEHSPHRYSKLRSNFLISASAQQTESKYLPKQCRPEWEPKERLRPEQHRETTQQIYRQGYCHPFDTAHSPHLSVKGIATLSNENKKMDRQKDRSPLTRIFAALSGDTGTSSSSIFLVISGFVCCSTSKPAVCIVGANRICISIP